MDREDLNVDMSSPAHPLSQMDYEQAKQAFIDRIRDSFSAERVAIKAHLGYYNALDFMRDDLFVALLSELSDFVFLSLGDKDKHVVNMKGLIATYLIERQTLNQKVI